MAKRVVSHKAKFNALASPPVLLEIKPFDTFLNKIDDQVVDQKGLAELVKAKNDLHKFGGIEAIAKLLQTNTENGINGDEEDLKRRRLAFGSNMYEKPKPKGLIHFVVEAFRDTTIIILLACAALSLAFGIRELGAKEGWYEVVSIFVVVFLVVAVSGGSNFRQERQFDKLSKINNNIKIDVVRVGRRQKVSIFEAVVDVVILNTGDQVPADGLFVDGHSFQVDESSMTGESYHVEVDSMRKPFLLSGSTICTEQLWIRSCLKTSQTAFLV